MWLIVSLATLFILFGDVPKYNPTSLGRVPEYDAVPLTVALFDVIESAPPVDIDKPELSDSVVNELIEPLTSFPFCIA